LYVVDVVSGEEQPEEAVPVESEATIEGGLVQNKDGQIMVKRRKPPYFDKRQQLDLILEAQRLVEFGDHRLGSTESNEEDQEVGAKCIDIWEDVVCLELLKDWSLPGTMELEESKRARKRMIKYSWKE
jgi:hypothetical protein